MLSWLTKAGRRRAGHVLALIYAFCSFAPSLALASSHCLAGENREQMLVRAHDHGASHVHDAASGMKLAMQAASTGHEVLDVRTDQPPPAKIPQGATCCSLISVPGLPAGSAENLELRSQRSLYLPGSYRRLADSAPPRHYRPPIS